MAKILKNTTVTDIDLDAGIFVPASGQTTVNPQDYAELSGSDDIYTYIGSGDILVNDGSKDLGIGDGVGLIKSSFINFSDNTIVGPQGPQGDKGDKGDKGDTGPAGIFGSEREYEESLGLSQTTSQNSTNPPTKITMTITGKPSGLYRLDWSYFWSGSNSGRDFRAEIEIDGVQKAYHSQEPKDPGIDQRHPSSGFISNIPLSGNHEIKLNYWTENDGEVSYISDARLELWRVE